MNGIVEPIAARARDGVPLGAYATDDALHYAFLEAEGPQLLSVPRGDAATPALAATFPLFGWDEREMSDEYGVVFVDPADPRPFRARDGVMPEAIVAHGAGVMQIVVGPVHAGIIEPGRFTFSSGGETVVHLDAQLGYAFRGVERALEGADAIAAAPRVARICGSCSAARSYAYALALEQLAGVAIAPEVDALRLALCELERIINHLGDLAMTASAAGWMPGFVRGMALKERGMRLAAQLAGHRLLFESIVPGGVGPNVRAPDADVAAYALLARDTHAYLSELFAKGSVVSRWSRAGIVSPAIAAAFGAVGPPHRAAGGTIDVRRSAPYGAYRERVVPLAGAHGGDVLARCTVKRDELTTSFALLVAALPQAAGTAIARMPATIPAGIGLGCVEGPRGAELVAVHVRSDGGIARFHAIAASYRNWPIVARAMEGNIVPDFPLVNKSFNLCYACADR